jgi:hypothetical protein
MALKPDREEFHYDISWYMDEAAERGGVVSVSTADSGGYPGGSHSVVTYAAAPSGKFPVGVLLNDVVDYDPSRQHGNPYRMQTLIGTKVTLIKDGWVTTNMILASDTPVGGEAAYLGPSGLFSLSPTPASARPIGQFLSSKDQDGFARVRVEI